VKYPIRENAELLIKVMIVTNTSSAAKYPETPAQLSRPAIAQKLIQL
jgi:hypothetical protein